LPEADDGVAIVTLNHTTTKQRIQGDALELARELWWVVCYDVASLFTWVDWLDAVTQKRTKKCIEAR
jgi:hypothetical protein